MLKRLIATTLMLLPATGFANVGKISGPITQENIGRFKYTTLQSENDRGSHRAEFDYGLDHDWTAELGLKLNDTPGAHPTIEETSAELLRTLTRQSEGWWLSSALVGEASLHTGGEANSFEAQWRLQRDDEHTLLRFNTMLSREFGGSDETTLGTRALATWKLHPNANPALEWHAEWGTLSQLEGNQPHWAGPALYGEVFRLEGGQRLDYQIAWAFGLNRPASNDVLRVGLEYKWEF